MSIGTIRIDKKGLEDLRESITDKLLIEWMNVDKSFNVVPSPVQIPLLDVLSKPPGLRNESDEKLIDDSLASRRVEIIIDQPVEIHRAEVEGPENALKDLQDRIEAD